MGTWAFDMTNPAGSHQTVRFWNKNGTIPATRVTIARNQARDPLTPVTYPNSVGKGAA